MMSASAPPVEDLSPIPKPSPIFTISNTVPGSEQNTPKTEVKSPQEDIHYINFKVDSTQIDKCFNFWKKTLWFTPQKFFEMAVIRDISQVLVPHWLFNVDCEVTIKANVLQSIVDPYTYVLKQEWRDIFDQKISHFDNIICLGTPLNEAHYVHLLESVKHWDPSSILQNADESTGWWVTLFRSFMGSEQQKKKSVSEYPLLPFDSWLYCFDRHCRKKVEELEIEQASLFLKKKGYSNVKDLSVNVRSVTPHFTKTLIYLPIFICLYQFENLYYTVIINGINGYATGERPYSSLGQIAQAGVSGLQAIDSYFRGKK
jgi:hypothetical protein